MWRKCWAFSNGRMGTQSKVGTLQASPPGNLRAVLTYHEVSQATGGSLYTVTPEQLRSHLALCVRRQSAAPLITFDDGHVSNFEQALPLLSQTGVRAVFFITAGWTERRPDFMSWAQLRELARLGHSVQSHSWSHKLLTHLGLEDLDFELSASKEALEQKIGAPVFSISIPAGRWNRRVLEACGRAGYQQVFISEPWVYNAQPEGIQVVGRFMVRRDTRLDRLEQFCAGSKKLLWSLRAQHAIKRLARGIVGDHVYQYIWRLVAKRPTEEWGSLV